MEEKTKEEGPRRSRCKGEYEGAWEPYSGTSEIRWSKTWHQCQFGGTLLYNIKWQLFPLLPEEMLLLSQMFYL